MGRTLLTIRHCRAELLTESSGGGLGETPDWQPDVIAVGKLFVHISGSGNDSPALEIRGSGHFSLQCTSHTMLAAHSGRLVFEYPPGSGMECALVASVSAIQQLVSVLTDHGCKVSWAANEGATWAARGVESFGSVIAGGIKAAGFAAGSGVRAAGRVARNSGLLQPEELEVHPDARSAAAGARGVTRKVAGVAGQVLDTVVSTIGTAAGAVSSQMPEPTEQWMADTKVLGGSSLKAGGQVWQAFQDASAGFWKDVADTSSDVIAHKYGEEVGQTARDSMHALGNALEVKAVISKKVAGMIAGKSCGPVAAALTNNGSEAQVAPALQAQLEGPPSSSSDIAKAVVSNAVSRAAAVPT